MTSHVVSDDELGWHEAEVAGRPGTSLCSMVSAHAASRPDRPAVIDSNGRHLTFRELQRLSGGMAARLAADGVGPGSCVGIFLERSPEFVVAAYAVMRAGAAYLPLDIATPQDRLEFVLSDAGAEAVISDGRELPAGSWRTIRVDEPIAVSDAHPGLDRSAPDDLAYVIYTSGSTGRPKGVELTHANLTNLVDWHVSAFAIVPTDRASQVASVGFDAAVWEIWPHLAAGAAVCIADEATRRSPQLLRDWLVAKKITIAFAPTVLAEQLVHLAWPAGTTLRTLLTGADVLHRRPAAGLPFALVNNYGPTECTVVATSGTVGPAQGEDTPSIGRPIGDTTALVLDESLQPVAPGDAGELCLAGTLVGRGYRNDPDLTASRFVTLHRDSGPPLRVYRTGDQVRLLDNGEVAFLGRLDRQIKLRGFRIEPAEIVAALDRAGGVAASAVVARGGPDGEPELVAYVVPAEDASPTTAELRHVLAARLPDYMVPATFVGLDTLPVTLHGKLDEGALPAPSPERLLPGQPSPASDTLGGSVEDQVGGMVRSLLELPAVDVQANIFLLGGHSMLAMQLVSRIQQVFGVKLPLRQLFDEPTVTGISAAVARRMPADRAEAHA
jgi:amino acid adenylation domain-containing protein